MDKTIGRPSHIEILEERNRNIRKLINSLRARRLKTAAVRGSLEGIKESIFEEVAKRYECSVDWVKKIYSDPKANLRYYEKKNGKPKKLT